MFHNTAAKVLPLLAAKLRALEEDSSLAKLSKLNLKHSPRDDLVGNETFEQPLAPGQISDFLLRVDALHQIGLLVGVGSQNDVQCRIPERLLPLLTVFLHSRGVKDLTVVLAHSKVAGSHGSALNRVDQVDALAVMLCELEHLAVVLKFQVL